MSVNSLFLNTFLWVITQCSSKRMTYKQMFSKICLVIKYIFFLIAVVCLTALEKADTSAIVNKNFSK